MSTTKTLRVDLSETDHRRLHAFAKAHRLSTAEAVQSMLRLAVSVLSPSLTQYVETAAASEGPLPKPPERAAWVFGEAGREAARLRSGLVVMTVDALARLTSDLRHHQARIPELIDTASRHEEQARVERARVACAKAALLRAECEGAVGQLVADGLEDDDDQMVEARADLREAIAAHDAALLVLRSYGAEP